MIIAFVSSVVPEVPEAEELLVRSGDRNFALTGLKKDSVIKLRKLLTISSELILRRLGRLAPELVMEADKRLIKALGLT